MILHLTDPPQPLSISALFVLWVKRHEKERSQKYGVETSGT